MESLDPGDDDRKLGLVLGCQLRIVSVDVDRDDDSSCADGRGMDSKDMCTDTFFKVPNTDGAIRPCSYERIAVVKSRSPDSALMTVKSLEESTCECAVDFDGFAIECNNDAVCVEDERCYNAVPDLDACGFGGFFWLGMVIRGGGGGVVGGVRGTALYGQ